MTARDPLVPWPDRDEFDIYNQGANDRLDALRPLIAAAEELFEMAAMSNDEPVRSAAAAYHAIRTPKGDPT